MATYLKLSMYLFRTRKCYYLIPNKLMTIQLWNKENFQPEVGSLRYPSNETLVSRRLGLEGLKNKKRKRGNNAFAPDQISLSQYWVAKNTKGNDLAVMQRSTPGREGIRKAWKSSLNIVTGVLAEKLTRYRLTQPVRPHACVVYEQLHLAFRLPQSAITSTRSFGLSRARVLLHLTCRNRYTTGNGFLDDPIWPRRTISSPNFPRRSTSPWNTPQSSKQSVSTVLDPAHSGHGTLSGNQLLCCGRDPLGEFWFPLTRRKTDRTSS
jgi:hypothetical protein